MAIDPDKGVTDLVQQLTDDSKRLLADEMRLARMETIESLHRAGRGALWLGLAAGTAMLVLVAFTLFSATLIGRIAGGHYWVGAFVTAAIDLAAGIWLVQRGLIALKKAPYALPETRSSLKLARD